MNFCSVSCSGDKDEFAQQIINKEETTKVEEIKKIISISSDFDWNNIPVKYNNSIWEIKDNFNLEGQSIILPNNVTISFIGGAISNGEVSGNKTTITSNSSSQIFNSINLDGDFVNEYLKPNWFGAIMDGVTDDRDTFVETLKQSYNIGAKVLVEKDIFLDVEKTGSKSIFLEDNTWIEGVNGANIIVNNLYSPAFWMALSKNISIKNITFLWDNVYDATNMRPDIATKENQQFIENYLKTKKKITFKSTNPIARGSISFMAIFLIDAAKNVTFDSVTLKAKGETADRFIPMGIKLKEQNTANQTVTHATFDNTGATNIPRNIILKNVSFDGALMAIQGIVDGFKSDGLKSYRYSDAQNINGDYIGGFDGVKYNFPPPHLIYLNDDKSIHYSCEEIKILNTVDYGQYVGSPNVRATASGYCNSLKLADSHADVTVDNYKSYRRDGFADIMNVTNGTFKNIFSESKIAIFEQRFKFSSLRFLGSLKNVVFENIIIKDKSDVLGVYPLDITKGDNVLMDNVHVYINEYTGENGLFGISGSNNKITNSSLTIEKHTSSKTYIGIILHDENTMNNGRNNFYDITIYGWRNIDSDPNGRCARMAFSNPKDGTNNSAIINDISNSFINQQNNNVKKNTWTRNETVNLGDGTKHLLNINIPSGFVLNAITANTIEKLASGILVSIGTSSDKKNNLLTAVSNVSGLASETNNIPATNSDKSISLYTDKNFNNIGKIEVKIELVKINQAN